MNMDATAEPHRRKMERKVVAALEDKRTPLEKLHSAYHELKAAGWDDICYAPKGIEVKVEGSKTRIWCVDASITALDLSSTIGAAVAELKNKV